MPPMVERTLRADKFGASREGFPSYDATDGREDSTGEEARVLRGGSGGDNYPDWFRGAYRLWSHPAYCSNG
jgi:hypothetical protein